MIDTFSINTLTNKPFSWKKSYRKNSISSRVFADFGRSKLESKEESTEWRVQSTELRTLIIVDLFQFDTTWKELCLLYWQLVIIICLDTMKFTCEVMKQQFRRRKRINRFLKQRKQSKWKQKLEKIKYS